MDALITNFHLPGSTLLMLVSAFMGRENALAVYREAVEREYRFLLVWRRDVHKVGFMRRGLAGRAAVKRERAFA